jgi:hypothetical protein
MIRNSKSLIPRVRLGCMSVPALFGLICLFATSAHAAGPFPKVAVLVQDKTPPGWFGWNKAGAGTLSSIEAALRKGLAAGDHCTILTRSQFDAVLAEQNLAYKNVVNDHTRLGQLVGADYIVIAELIADTKNTDRKTLTAYGISETQTSLSSQAQLDVSLLQVSSGAVVDQQQFSEGLSGSHEALAAVLGQAANWLRSLEFKSPSAKGLNYEVRIAPTSGGRPIRGLDVLVDGSFQANTPVTLNLDSGVREITLKHGDKILWSNRLRVSRDFAIQPELASEATDIP